MSIKKIVGVTAIAAAIFFATRKKKENETVKNNNQPLALENKIINVENGKGWYFVKNGKLYGIMGDQAFASLKIPVNDVINLSLNQVLDLQVTGTVDATGVLNTFNPSYPITKEVNFKQSLNSPGLNLKSKPMCVRVNQDRSTTLYTPINGNCPYGGRVEQPGIAATKTLTAKFV